jgi:cyclophilin family peptidyl-prolyl cis-trans isomerase
MFKRYFLLLGFLCYPAISGLAVEKEAPAPPRPGPAGVEFQRVLGEWKTLIGDLGALRAKYRTAKKEDRPEIKEQWQELIEKGRALEPQLVAAAEKAFAEAPNGDQQVTDLLLDIFNTQMQRDDYENAVRIGKLLVGNHVGGAKAAVYTGMAALCIGDFDDAENYLLMAAKEGFFQKPESQDKLSIQGKYYMANLPQYKKNWEKEQQIRQTEAKADDLPRVLIKTNKGDIEAELFENEAPNTVANFITLAEKGFYNGLPFHRVLEGFMAQGGDPKGDGSGGPGYSIACECYQPNHRLHFRGSLSMAHAGRDTGGSQFFITFVPTSHLDGKHTVFGRVINGFDVLAKIQRRDPDDPNAPEPDKILEIKVLRKRPHEYVVKKID